MKNLILLALALLPVFGFADTKISQLRLLTPAEIGSLDSFPLVSVSNNETVRLKLSDLLSIPALQAPNFTGTVTASAFSGNGAALTSLNASALTSGTLPAARLPFPTASTLGGIVSLAATSSNWIRSIGTDGIPTVSQPAFTDISGVASAAQLPNPSASTLGGIRSYAAVSNQWINAISTSGIPSSTQPAFTNISGTVAAAQLPNPTSSTLGGVQSAAAVSNQWINSISTSGVPALSQPAFSNISGTATIGQGGTGQTTQTAAFDALSPNTTKGDLTVRGTSNNVRLPIGSDGQVPVADSTQSSGLKWATLQQGAKNYITYNNFENNATTGWSLTHSTLDSTTKLPNQASGSWSSAAGTLSIAATSSSPLAGTYSMNYVSSNATTAGDMVVSQAYTIDTEDQAKPLTFKFYYSATSNPTNGNYSGTSSNSFGVAIYDVTNSAWIQPAGVWNVVQNSGVGYSTGTFQTASNMTQFRFAFFNANATSGATTIEVDDFSVGPQTAPMGAPMSDWISFTPTSSWTANTTATGYWRRIGDSMQVVSKVVCSGAPTAADLSFSIPSGYTIDTAKLPGAAAVNTVAVGSAVINDSGTRDYVGTAIYDSTTTVRVAHSESGNNGQVNATNPIVFGASDAVWVNYTVPISGWGSTVQMSNDTDTRVVAFYTSNTTPTGTISGGYNNMIFSSGSVAKDTHNAYDSSNGRYTCPVTGYYTVSGTAEYTAASIAVGNTAALAIAKNGSALFATGFRAESTSNVTKYLNITNPVFCNAGEYFTLQSLYGATTPSYSASLTGSSFAVSRVSGPATIAATETVAARYYGATATITSSNSDITWSTKDYDTHGALSGATFTTPVSGKYDFSGAIYVSAASVAAGNTCSTQFVKNGSSTTLPFHAHVYQNTNTTAVTIPFNYAAMNLLAGDAIKIQTSCNTTTPAISANNGGNYISIKRVGN